eukprot:scaffold295_cov257-Pinguiococcus_pyrenoidosus.AAC.1
MTHDAAAAPSWSRQDHSSDAQGTSVETAVQEKGHKPGTLRQLTRSGSTDPRRRKHSKGVGGCALQPLSGTC